MFSQQIEELKESYQEKLENTFEMYKDAIKEHAYQSALSSLEDELLAEQQTVEVRRVGGFTSEDLLVQLFLVVTSGNERTCLKQSLPKTSNWKYSARPLGISNPFKSRFSMVNHPICSAGSET